MPRTKVILYCEEDGACPFLEWTEQLPVKAQAKCLLRVERLRELGTNCGGRRRICCGMESTNSARVCRASTTGFSISSHGAIAAVVVHGIVKERAAPPKEIDRAIERKRRFEANPAKHGREESTK